MGIQVKGIGHIGILVSDFERSFDENRLGAHPGTGHGNRLGL